MSKVERLRERARTAEARDPRSAIEAWLDVLKVQEEESDPNPDLSIYNRIGDLYLKVKDPSQAADYYERGVDRYAELGFHNNAIALCNKVLRNAPGRPTAYLKLAKLYAAKGFLAEARQNFVEYAERMKRAGKLDHAFAALKQVTDLSPESESLRRMLEDHLRTYGEVKGRPGRASSAVEGPPSAPPEPRSPKRKTSSLVFLDLDEPSPVKAPAAPAAKAPAPPPPPPKAEPRAPEPRRGGRDLEYVGGAEPPRKPAPEALELEPTALDDGSGAPAGAIEGLEATSFDFQDVRRSLTNVPRVSDDEVPETPVPPLGGLEPTIEEGLEFELPVEPEALPPAPPVREVAPPPRQAPPPRPAPSAPPPSPAPPPPSRAREAVDIPPLEIEPEFQSAATAGHHEIDEEPLVVDAGDEPLSSWIQHSEDAGGTSLGGRSQGYIDLGLDGVTTGDTFAPAGGTAAAIPSRPSIDELESRVADNPDDPAAHRSLGEALIETGDRERGIEELDLAAVGYEAEGNLQQAQDLLNEVLRLDPNSVRHRQRVVEYAYRAGDRDLLIEAYLELADALLRNNLADKAQAVYERVAEHDPHNARAQAALSMLTAPPAAAGPTPPESARMRVRDDAKTDGDFIDLGALVLEEAEEQPRDTRMKVEDEAPSGDEERDFQEMLARFKQGIDENIDETDFQSHYDLGVAFKEMGLLDEAISEFQKALRAPEGKLRTSEALGVCFLEKGALGVAESILRRGLELPAAGDQERLGVLYWLARALEGQGRITEARDYYGRVFAVDIRFMDVGERVRTLSRA